MTTEINMLKQMLKMQKTLQESAYGYDFDEMDTKERVVFLKEMSIHVNQELNEMLYELPFFKPWKDYSKMTVEEQDVAMTKARKEFIDFMHFTLNLALGLGMSADDVFNEYYYKNIENYKRQEEGYTHEKQYR